MSNNSNSSSRETYRYDVLNGDDERVRGGQVSAMIPDELTWLEGIDVLEDLAYAKETAKGLPESYSIVEA